MTWYSPNLDDFRCKRLAPKRELPASCNISKWGPRYQTASVGEQYIAIGDVFDVFHVLRGKYEVLVGS
jgi:hypothetical protein